MMLGHEKKKNRDNVVRLIRKRWNGNKRVFKQHKFIKNRRI